MLGWPVAKQEAALGDALDRQQLYQDMLTDERAKRPNRISPEWLTERARLLRPSSRKGDQIHVATLLALAVSEADLVSVLAAATGRSSIIFAHDSRKDFPPGGDATDVARAIDDWQKAKEAARTEPGRLEGVRVAAEKKRARTLKAVKVARPLWRDTKPNRLTTAQIAEQAGVSEKTLYSELGRRPAIRKGRSG